METEKPIREVLQRIAFECQESGATKWQILKILKELEEFEGTEQQLKRKASEALGKVNPEAAKTFLSFEKMRVYTSAQKLEPFDRGNIIKSLLRETGISRHVAEKIGSEVEDKIKDLKIEYLNTHIIREMVGVKLLEYGHEPVHSQYARIGMPVYDVSKKLVTGEFDGAQILAEYNWLAEIPATARELHFETIMHIFAPEDFSTKIFCAAKFFGEGLEHAARDAQKLDRLCTLPATARGFNFTCAAARKIPKKKMAEECSKAGAMFSLTGKKRFAELALFADNDWQAGGQKKKDAMRMANAFLPSGSESLEFYVSVDSKYQLKLLEKKSLPAKLIIASGTRTKNAAFPGFFLGAEQTSVVQAVGINLGKISEMSLTREERFFEKIEELKPEIRALCEKKKSLLQKRPGFEQFVSDKPLNAVCLSGLCSAAGAIDNDNRARVAEAVISSFQKDGFAVSENMDAAVQSRFGAADNRVETEKMLLEIGVRQRKSYGFCYSAKTLKEAEGLLVDCPFVEIGAMQNSRSPL